MIYVEQAYILGANGWIWCAAFEKVAFKCLDYLFVSVFNDAMSAF
jgi:hypothetical protein